VLKEVNSRNAVSHDVRRRRPNGAVVNPSRSADHRRPTSEPVGRLTDSAGRHHAQPKRSSHRVAAATVLSSLLALSAGLYPLSNNSHLLDLYPPKYGLADPPASAEFPVVNVPEVILLDLKHILPGLLQSFELAFPSSTADSPVVTKSVRSLKALVAVAETSPGLLSAGGGGGGGHPERRRSRNLPAELMLGVGNLLESLTASTQDLALAGIDTLQTAALNRLIGFLQLQFPGLSLHEIAPVHEATPVEVVQIGAPDINAADVPITQPVQAITAPVQPTIVPVTAPLPVAPPDPEVVVEPSAAPRDVSLLKPHLTTPVSDVAKNALAGTRPVVGKTVSTVTSGVGQTVSGVSGTLGSVTGSLGSVSKSLGSVSRALGGSSSGSDAGSSSGG
jgi:hypothetical protein